MSGATLREGEGHLYVLRFSDGRIKVGKTSNPPERRIGEHRRHALVYGLDIAEQWTSEPHVDYGGNEQALIRWCAVRAKSVAGNEYFTGLKFGEVVDFAASLRTRRGVKERSSGRAKGGIDYMLPLVMGTLHEDHEPHENARDLRFRTMKVQRAMLEAIGQLFEHLECVHDDVAVDPVRYGSYAEFHNFKGVERLITASVALEVARGCLAEAEGQLVAGETALAVASRLLLNPEFDADRNWNELVRDDPAYRAALDAIPGSGATDGRFLVAPLVKAIVD